jgi:CubicO group peptidase (beta-lactamase class C family)
LFLTLLATAAGCTATPRTAAFNPRTLEHAIDAVMAEQLPACGVPGAVVAVGFEHGRTSRLWVKAYGHRSTEPAETPMTPDAIFDLASMTKPLAVGTSMMILVDRGLVRPDDPVGRFLPEFREGDKADVTVRHLMTHTSGEKPFLGPPERKQIAEAEPDDIPGATRRYIRSVALTEPPGRRVRYSCLNAILCAEIVREVTGRGIDEFARDEIFRPLGMADTGFRPPVAMLDRLVPTTRGGPRARGAGGFLCGDVHDPIAAMQDGVSGNAGLFASAGDVARLARMMLRGGELDGVRVLSPQAVAAMTSIQNDDLQTEAEREDARGLLWDIYPADPVKTGLDRHAAYGHTGYTGTMIRVYPDLGIYVILLTNRVHPDDKAKVEPLRTAVRGAVAD